MLKRFKKAQQPRCYATGQPLASSFRWVDLPEVPGKELKREDKSIGHELTTTYLGFMMAYAI